MQGLSEFVHLIKRMYIHETKTAGVWKEALVQYDLHYDKKNGVPRSLTEVIGIYRKQML